MSPAPTIMPLFDYAAFTAGTGRHPIADHDLVVIDLETTGVYTPPHRICEIAMVRIHQGQVIDEYSTIVNPQRDAGPIHIHQLTNAELRSAPAFLDIAGDVLDRVRNATIVAHYAPFEEQFLAAEFAHAGITMPVLPALCTHELARQLVPGGIECDLRTLCHQFRIPLVDAHTALGDARATALLVRTLLRVVETLDEVLTTAVAPPIVPFRPTLAAPVTRSDGLLIPPGAGVARSDHLLEPGWHIDPTHQGTYRWWSGTDWSAITAGTKSERGIPMHDATQRSTPPLPGR